MKSPQLQYEGVQKANNDAVTYIHCTEYLAVYRSGLQQILDLFGYLLEFRYSDSKIDFGIRLMNVQLQIAAIFVASSSALHLRS